MKSTTPAAFLSLLAGTALAVGPAAPQGKAKVTMVEDFKWTNPFHPSLSLHDKFSASCSARKTFAATEYTLHDLFNPQPKGLLNWAESLKKTFTGRPYPGDWEGKDPHQYNRHIVKMNYGDVPVAVREWIETQETTGGEGKGLFVVYRKQENKAHRINDPVAFEEGKADRAGDGDRVVVFAPGAVYDVLPLWVAEGSDCQDTLLDLSRYTETPADGAVVSWTLDVSHPDMATNSRDMKFTVKAEVLEAKPVEEGAEDPAAEGKSGEDPPAEKDEL